MVRNRSAHRYGHPLALRRMPLASLTGATSGISVKAGTGTTGLPAIYFGGGALGSNSMPKDGGVVGIRTLRNGFPVLMWQE